MFVSSAANAKTAIAHAITTKAKIATDRVRRGGLIDVVVTWVKTPFQTAASDSSASSMTDAAMTVHALHRVAGGRRPSHDVGHEVPVPAEAVLLEDRRVVGLDEVRLVEVLEREALGMVVSVVRLGEVLADEGVGQVAVDALRVRV